MPLHFIIVVDRSVKIGAAESYQLKYERAMKAEKFHIDGENVPHCFSLAPSVYLFVSK